MLDLETLQAMKETIESHIGADDLMSYEVEDNKTAFVRKWLLREFPVELAADPDIVIASGVKAWRSAFKNTRNALQPNAGGTKSRFINPYGSI